MSTFSGPEVVVEKLTAEQLFNKLSNLSNLKEIMPSTIDNFEATEDSCSFKMKGMPGKIKTTINPIKTLTPRFITKALEKSKQSK